MKMIDKIILVVCGFAMLYTCELRADTFLDVNGLSVHSQSSFVYKGETKEFNSNNTGLGITTDILDYLDFKAGLYQNSYYRNTAYAGINLHIPYTQRTIIISPGIAVGLATGYDKTPVNAGAVLLYVIPNITIQYKDLRAMVGYIPASPVEKEDAVSAVTLQLQYQLN